MLPNLYGTVLAETRSDLMSKVLQFTLRGKTSRRVKRRYPTKVDYDEEERRTRLKYCTACGLMFVVGQEIVSRISGSEGHRLRYCLPCARRLKIV